jgi:hypothetical protein
MLYDEQGKPVEGALTPDEVKTQLADLQTKAEQANKELSEYKETGPGKSIAALREARDLAVKELNDFKTNAVTELGKMKTDMESKELDDTIAKIAEGDADVAKSIKENYLGSVKDTDTPDQKQKKLGDAYKLSIGGSVNPEILRTIGTGAGAPPANIDGQGGNWPQPLVELAGRLGISPEDLKNKPYHGKNK